eukprot:CAMPEP_0113320896 /NCGR_PEP_ID=MMETSP0010_2-20120614/14562_1 /TAXON_ID=216773 ORGANISM="Corethron hystrix, Strain 308" /NCGR_SAMPLE_ID=MMETSP0010_2 /ASSEMBLY_ACC=CAM_ASM_000155 /LENGTH=90 /DNA_ID=CAMNT_0000178851 /DNA_START=259 /DNA_END=528 /DNA_ORIENTATION=- /assembly_acc=CAM_ASM_000155
MNVLEYEKDFRTRFEAALRVFDIEHKPDLSKIKESTYRDIPEVLVWLEKRRRLVSRYLDELSGSTKYHANVFNQMTTTAITMVELEKEGL